MSGHLKGHNSIGVIATIKKIVRHQKKMPLNWDINNGENLKKNVNKFEIGSLKKIIKMEGKIVIRFGFNTWGPYERYKHIS